MEHSGKNELTDKESQRTDGNIDKIQVKCASTRQEWKQGFGYLIQPDCHMAFRNAQSAFQETGEQITEHRCYPDEQADRPIKSDDRGNGRGKNNGRADAANCLGTAKERPIVENRTPKSKG